MTQQPEKRSGDGIGRNSGGDHRRADSNEARGQSPTKRYVFTNWRDRDDHELCLHALIGVPASTPIQGRTGVATAEWVVVERVDGRALLCNGLHTGSCEWPWEVGSASME